MSVSNPQKTISPAVLSCGDTATVTIRFDAAPELFRDPADLVLIMDRSSSMTQDRLTRAKAAARRLIADMAGASGGVDAIANGSRMGLVSFADAATADVALTTDISALNDGVDSLVRGGFTNHRAAFEAAEAMQDPQSTARQAVVLFTDGVTNMGGDATAVTDRMKAAGTEIYCIGLTADEAKLELWASSPADVHVASTDQVDQLGRVFREITAEVVRAGALDAVIRETISPEFKLIGAESATGGTVSVTGPQSLVWALDAVGISGRETAELTLEILHIGSTDGPVNVNQELIYEDRQGSELHFPALTADVDCSDGVIYPEPCPSPTFFGLDSCQDSVNLDLPPVDLTSLGRIVQVNVTVRNVCPGKRAAVAVLLTEEGENGEEYARGIKTLTLPPMGGDTCRDVVLRCIRFVVPEEGRPATLCKARTFRARVMANYLDTDFVCCDAQSVIL